MSSVDFNSSVSSSSDPSSVSSSSGTSSDTPPVSDTGSGDTISTSTAPSQAQIMQGSRINLSKWNLTYQDAVIALKKILTQKEVGDYNTFSKFDSVGGIEAAAFRQILKNADKISSTLDNLSSGGQQKQVDDINTSIDTENQAKPADKGQIDAMNSAGDAYNQATSDFNAGTITQAQYDAATATYQTAVDTYTTYMTGRNAAIQAFNDNNSQYNTAINSINKQIALANVAIVQKGGTPIPLQPLAPTEDPLGTPGTTPPISAIPPVANLTKIKFVAMTPKEVTAAQNSFQKALDFIANSLLNRTSRLNETLQTSQSNVNNIYFFQRGKTFSKANTVVDAHSEASSAPSGGSANVGSSSIAAGLNQNSAEGFISTSLLTAAAQQFINAPVPEEFTQQLNDFMQTALQSAGLFSSVPALQTLGNKLGSVQPDSTAANLATNLAFSDQILQLVESDVIDQGVKGTLTNSANIGANPADVPQLANNIANTVRVQLLLLAIFGLGAALHTPGLAPQFFANLQKTLPDGAPSLTTPVGDQQDTGAPQQVPPNVPTSPTVGLQPPTDQSSISGQSTATPVAENVPDTRVQELQAEFLSQTSTQAETNPTGPSAASSDQTSLANQNLDKSVFEASLVNQLINLGINQDTASKSAGKIATQLFNQLADFKSAEDFQYALNDLLQSDSKLEYKMSDRNALTLATQADIGSANPSSALLLPYASVVLSPQDLQKEVSDNIVQQLQFQFGRARAEEIANQVISTLFGQNGFVAITGPTEITKADPVSSVMQSPTAFSAPAMTQPLSARSTDPQNLRDENTQTDSPSLLGSFQNYFRELIQDKNLPSVAHLVDNFRNFSAPNVDLYVFLQDFIDPSKAFLSGATGIMYGGKEPNNQYLPNNVDIPE